MSLPTTAWYEKAAYAIVRQGKTLFQYVNEANLGLTTSDCKKVAETAEFQACLRVERNKFYKELARDNSRTRGTAIGQLLYAIEQMLNKEQYDKAANAIIQLFKAEGWLNEGTQVNIIESLKGNDIDALRRKIEEQKKAKLAN